MFILQSRIIKKLAEEGPCVILGRCADYVLRERTDVLHVFVHAPVAWRREYAKTNPIVKATTEKGIRDEIDKTDRQRAAYYNYYTQNRWGDVHNYDLSVNAALGKDACVKMILDAVEAQGEIHGLTPPVTPGQAVKQQAVELWAGCGRILPIFSARTEGILNPGHGPKEASE